MSIRHAARFLLALLLATFVMLAVRAFAFTIYTVPDKGWEPDLHQGDRVIVNKLDRVPIKKSDLIAFTDSAAQVCFVGRVTSFVVVKIFTVFLIFAASVADVPTVNFTRFVLVVVIYWCISTRSLAKYIDYIILNFENSNTFFNLFWSCPVVPET